jgi:hypothetical protein
MTKRELIDEILLLNATADPAFLARFDTSDLSEYLHALRVSRNSGRRPAYSRNRQEQAVRASTRRRAKRQEPPAFEPVGAGECPWEDYRSVPGQRSLF